MCREPVATHITYTQGGGKYIDDVRIANVVRSASWFATQYQTAAMWMYGR